MNLILTFPFHECCERRTIASVVGGLTLLLATKTNKWIPDRNEVNPACTSASTTNYAGRYYQQKIESINITTEIIREPYARGKLENIQKLKSMEEDQ